MGHSCVDAGWALRRATRWHGILPDGEASADWPWFVLSTGSNAAACWGRRLLLPRIRVRSLWPNSSEVRNLAKTSWIFARQRCATSICMSECYGCARFEYETSIRTSTITKMTITAITIHVLSVPRARKVLGCGFELIPKLDAMGPSLARNSVQPRCQQSEAGRWMR
jgi:hypothetical protein